MGRFDKCICECGYEGPAEWVKTVERRDGGILEGEGLGCPKCKNMLSSGKIKLQEELDNEQ